MILTRAPLRISFAGGGSDLPAYTQHSPGAVFSAAIQLYMHIAYNPRPIERGIRLAYSRTENVANSGALKHGIAREILRDVKDVEVHSICDVSGGTGLGSSSAYAVALTLAAHHGYTKNSFNEETLARYAGIMEIDRLKKPIGLQDHYASAFGGLRLYMFDAVGGVSVGIRVDGTALQSRLMLVYLGAARDQAPILRAQADAMSDPNKRRQVTRMAALAHTMSEVVDSGDLYSFGLALHEAWMIKREITDGITTPRIDALYDTARKAGALGGKLCGAGGAGFMLFYADQENTLGVKAALLQGAGIEARDILPVRFDTEGAKVVYSD